MEARSMGGWADGTVSGLIQGAEEGRMQEECGEGEQG
jgi:hypothetical protein